MVCIRDVELLFLPACIWYAENWFEKEEQYI